MAKIARRRGYSETEGGRVYQHPTVLQSKLQMSDKNHSDKSESADRAVNNSTIGISSAAHSERGALDLEAPVRDGRYGEIFSRYLPEVADELIDTRAVRMIVEMEYNCRRIQKMFGRLPIGQEARIALELIRRDIDCLLWFVCDTLSKDLREQWGYEVSGPAYEWR